jgi:hypothetical protein
MFLYLNNIDAMFQFLSILSKMFLYLNNIDAMFQFLSILTVNIAAMLLNLDPICSVPDHVYTSPVVSNFLVLLCCLKPLLTMYRV